MDLRTYENLYHRDLVYNQADIVKAKIVIYFIKMIKLLMISATTFFLTSCALLSSFPGTKEEIESGKNACKSIIKALAVHHSQQNGYPKDLNQIAPNSAPREFEIYYRKTIEASYALGFAYTKWGTSYCEYRPEKNWDCLTKH